MTHTEAADLILSEADAPPMDWYLPEVRDAILATVATVMDAARADALEEAAKVADGWLKSDFDESANTMCQNISADIRALAQSSAQENKGASK